MRKTKTTISIFFSIVALLLLIVALSACNNLNEDNYVNKYPLNDCDKSILEYNDHNNKVSFGKVYSFNDVSVYFDTDTINKRSIDETIDSVVTINNLLSKKKLIDFPKNVYVSNELVFFMWTDEDGTANFSIPNAPAEEILAWILYFKYNRCNTNQNTPFGLFAGMSSYWLQIPEYDSFILSSTETVGYLTELQFPIYEQNNLAPAERNYAWSFSTYFVKSMLTSANTEEDILSLDKDSLASWLKANIGISLPNYCFKPYSKKYEYKIEQGCFTYFVNKEYNDLILPSSFFSTSYDVLSDWLGDNERTTKESDEVFSIYNMYNIKVYLDNGLNSSGITGYAREDYIDLYSVGSFSHEYIHHILFYLGKNGNAREVIPEMHATTSKYSKAMWYYLFTGQAENFPYNEDVGELKLYSEALDLYKKYVNEAIDCDNFDFWLFADCFSAVHTKKGTTFIHRLQPDSLAYYIAWFYGSEYVWELNMNNQPVIEGKPYLDIVEEWYQYVLSLKK